MSAFSLSMFHTADIPTHQCQMLSHVVNKNTLIFTCFATSTKHWFKKSWYRNTKIKIKTKCRGCPSLAASNRICVDYTLWRRDKEIKVPHWLKGVLQLIRSQARLLIRNHRHWFHRWLLLFLGSNLSRSRQGSASLLLRQPSLIIMQRGQELFHIQVARKAIHELLPFLQS